MGQDQAIRLTAFVGRSFLNSDKQLWHELRDILDSLKPMGFAFEDAKEAQVRPISDKVRALVTSNDVYIGLLTRRYPIYEMPETLLGRLGLFHKFEPNQWTTSEWVVEEIGFAIGKDRPVLLLIEDGVVFPTTDLDADTEFVRFQRSHISESQSAITTMLSNLIASRVTTLLPASPATGDAPPPEPQPTPEPPKATFGDQLQALQKAAAASNQSEAERIHAAIVADEADAEDRERIELFLLGERARYGDASALAGLKAKCAQDPLNFDALYQLFDVYLSFNQFRDAHELMLKNAHRIDQSLLTTANLQAARALRRDGKPKDALAIAVSRLAIEPDEPRKTSLLRSAAYSAEALSDIDLEISLHEKALDLNPANNDVRFRLAYLYGDSERQKLAAYHYGVLYNKVDWPGVGNNLGAAYGELNLKAARVDRYREVADRHGLSKANLAVLYADAGFLKEASELANAVITSDSEDATARARFALSEIDSLRRKNKEEIAKIPGAVRDERQFMVNYADAYCLAKAVSISGNFETAHGPMQIEVHGSTISGKGDFTKTLARLGLLATPIIGLRRPSGTYTRRFTLELTGLVHNAAGTFELKICGFEPDSPTPDSTRNLKGLFFTSPDGASIRFLEREDKRHTISEAKRTSP